jgi:chemotaxis response regulator CheB
MPGAVSRAGLADEVLPLDGVAPSVTRRLSQSLSEVSA